ncbi:alpha/beta hydrolase [Geminisphaera colitermitum]|uniref:alpha/beta hydrolase n=1 Tax=Geminisphaera colitermitum TaxID=1148786 RepID=UPI000158CB15|nr:alpha/beta hydrolase [Geminisphaera colitermitum]
MKHQLNPLRILPLLAAIIVTATLSAVTAATAAPAVTTPLPDKVVYKTAGDIPLHLYIYEPASSPPSADARPALLFIHGGGWDHGRPTRKNAVELAKKFADMGLVTFALQYRLIPGWKDMHKQSEAEKNAYGGTISDKNTVFDSVRDARSAMRYLRAHAAELRIDPARIAVAGGSAGGHLTASTTLLIGPDIDEPGEDTSISCAANALIFFNPVIDTSRTGYGNKKIGARWKELSPVDHVRSGLPPAILFHGTADRTVPFANAQKFHDAMLAAGNTCEFYPHEGGDHGYISKDPALLKDGLGKIENFLRRNAILPPPSPPAEQ